jgi:hypothetical protein
MALHIPNSSKVLKLKDKTEKVFPSTELKTSHLGNDFR